MKRLCYLHSGSARKVQRKPRLIAYLHESRFHGSNAVAPLKHQTLSRYPSPVSTIPRQQCRGPIEAVLTRRGASGPEGFHGSNAVAPLKQAQ